MFAPILVDSVGSSGISDIQSTEGAAGVACVSSSLYSPGGSSSSDVGEGGRRGNESLRSEFEYTVTVLVVMLVRAAAAATLNHCCC